MQSIATNAICFLLDMFFTSVSQQVAIRALLGFFRSVVVSRDVTTARQEVGFQAENTTPLVAPHPTIDL